MKTKRADSGEALPPIRLLVADDHSLVRAGLCSLLSRTPGIEVVGEAADGRGAVRLAEKEKPDVVLLDVAMPGLSGLEATAQLLRCCPSSRVIIVSMYAMEEYVIQALQAGATGYLLKDGDAAELELAVRKVAKGEGYLSPGVSKFVSDYIRRLPNGSSATYSYSIYELLTARQREVLQLIAEGNSNRRMSEILNVSVKTVETHRRKLMERLDIRDVAGLVRYAIRVGLVSPDV